jgi:multimeric flavodoxin WrbA
MKILAIIGSPRGKGNTYRTVRKVEERMKAQGDIQFDYLFLKDANLQSCKGCNICLLKGEDRCPLKDDRADIDQRMREADGVVFASPTYVLNVTALMKNFIDRFAFSSHRPRFFKPAMAISTTGATGAELVSFLLGLTAGSWGFDVVSKVSALTPFDGKAYVHKDMAKYNSKMEKKLDKAARKFYTAVRQGRRQPGVFSIAQFLLRKASFMKEPEENLDRIYFERNGWLDRNAKYFYEIKAGAIKMGAARCIEAVLRRFA